MQNNKTQKLVVTGLMTAVIAVATAVIPVPVPFTNGYIHIGDSMIFLSVLLLGWKYGAFAAGAGSALADLYLGYVHWAPWTLGIKAAMAVIMGLILQQCMNSKKMTAAFCCVIAGMWACFHFLVQQIVRREAGSNGPALYEDAGVSSASEFGAFLDQVQSQLMIAAIAIPVGLVLVAFLVRRVEKILIPVYQLVAMTATGLWMVFGYYIAGGVIYGNFAVAAFSIPANMIQFVMGFALAALAAAALYKTPAARYFTYRTLRPAPEEGEKAEGGSPR